MRFIISFFLIIFYVNSLYTRDFNTPINELKHEIKILYNKILNTQKSLLIRVKHLGHLHSKQLKHENFLIQNTHTIQEITQNIVTNKGCSEKEQIKLQEFQQQDSQHIKALEILDDRVKNLKNSIKNINLLIEQTLFEVAKKQGLLEQLSLDGKR